MCICVSVIPRSSHCPAFDWFTVCKNEGVGTELRQCLLKYTMKEASSKLEICVYSVVQTLHERF